MSDDVYDGKDPIISADGVKHDFEPGTPMSVVDKVMKDYAEEHRDKTSTMQQIGRGMADPAYGLGQMMNHIMPSPPLLETAGGREYLSQPIDTVAEGDKIIRDREAGIQKERGGSKNTDWARMIGQALSPVNFLGGIGAAKGAQAAIAPVAERLLPSGLALGVETAGAGVAAGGAAGAVEPVMDPKHFAREKLQQVGLGSIIGGGIGAGGGAASAALSGWGSYLARTHPDNLMSDAVVKILKRFKQDEKAGGPSATEALELVEAANKPMALVDTGPKGGNVEGLGGHVARQPGESRAVAKGFLTERDKEAAARLEQDIGKHISSGPTAFQATEGMLESRSAASTPLYEQAHALENVWSPRLAELFEVPQIKQGLQAGYDLESVLSAARGKPLTASQMGVDVGVDGSIKMTGKPNMRLLDMAKQGLDAMVSDERDAITGRLSKRGYALNELREAYVKALDEADKSGLYKKARQTWAGYSASMDAIKMGKAVFGSHPEEFEATLTRMAPSDREFVNIGIADTLREKLLKAGFSGDESKQILKNGWMRKQLKPAFEKNADFESFIDAVTAERNMFERGARMVGNSASAERLGEAVDSNTENMLAVGKMAAQASTGKLLGLVKGAWSFYKDIGLKPNPELNEKIAQILFTTNVPEDAKRMLRSGVIPPRVNPKQNAVERTAEAGMIGASQMGGAAGELTSDRQNAGIVQ